MVPPSARVCGMVLVVLVVMVVLVVVVVVLAVLTALVMSVALVLAVLVVVMVLVVVVVRMLVVCGGVAPTPGACTRVTRRTLYTSVVCQMPASLYGSFASSSSKSARSFAAPQITMPSTMY